jgi:MFS superfamily sulfate permease-like transporter
MLRLLRPSNLLITSGLIATAYAWLSGLGAEAVIMTVTTLVLVIIHRRCMMMDFPLSALAVGAGVAALLYVNDADPAAVAVFFSSLMLGLDADSQPHGLPHFASVFLVGLYATVSTLLLAGFWLALLVFVATLVAAWVVDAATARRHRQNLHTTIFVK